KNLAQPAGLVLISPWVDLTLANRQQVSDKIDPLLRWSTLDVATQCYLNGIDRKDPLASAIFADLSGLAPMLIQVGSEEILLGDAQSLYDQAKKCQVDVSFNLYQQGWHVFQLQAGLINMADQAIDEISQFMDGVTAASASHPQEACS
ncbi:MAG: alpha/beta hydrolase fold domain-containing protein, partial [Bermanella sp.]